LWAQLKTLARLRRISDAADLVAALPLNRFVNLLADGIDVLFRPDGPFSLKPQGLPSHVARVPWGHRGGYKPSLFAPRVEGPPPVGSGAFSVMRPVRLRFWQH